MNIDLIHIISFGGIRNREISPDNGVNIILGSNESGKSSVAMFIKFIFYGLSAKAEKTGEASERVRYINRETGQAAGYVIITLDNGTKYRIERAVIESDNSPTRERVRIINIQTGESSIGTDPGEIFFGVSCETFMNTCFIGQSSRIRPDSGGIEGAVDNLLSSADENIDIKKAIRTLDGMRREILHKNGNGGELNELRERKAALEAEIKNYSGKAAEQLSLSVSLSDINKRIDELKEASQRLNGIFHAVDKIKARKRLDGIAQIESDMTELQTTLDELDSSQFGGSFIEGLNEAETDIRFCRLSAQDSIRIPPTETKEKPPEATEDAHNTETSEYAKALYSSSRVSFAVFIALFISGIFGLVASVVMYLWNTETYLFPMLVTLLLITMAFVFTGKYVRTTVKLNKLLKSRGVDSIEELDEFENADELYDIDEDGEGEEDGYYYTPEGSDGAAGEDIRRDEEAQRYNAAVERLAWLCEIADIDFDPNRDIDEIIAELRTAADTMSADREALRERLAVLRGKREAMNEQISDADRSEIIREYNSVMNTPAGAEAAAMTTEQLKNAAKERDFTINALKSAEKRSLELEARLAELGSLSHTPDEAASEIDRLNSRIEELSLRHDACELAKDALNTAGEKVRSGIIPKLARSASMILDGATAGAHEGMTLDRDFNVGCRSGNNVISREHMSRGTSDLVYLSLRIALADEIIKKEAPFMVFDESFAHIDADRVERMISLMVDGQYFVFTCHSDEAEAASAAGASVIELKKGVSYD